GDGGAGPPGGRQGQPRHGRRLPLDAGEPVSGPQPMFAAVLKGPGQVVVEAVPVPQVGDGDVLVAIELCGVCGTDLHMVLEGWGAPGSWHGHEWTGRVAAVGGGVTRWSVGDAV